MSPNTYAKYDTSIDLFKTYMESYWPGHDQDEYNRVTETGGTFCDTFGPEEIIGGYSEFLGYFMPHKVMCGKDTMKAVGTVTKKLAKWLADNGYADDTADAQEQAKEAAKDLPAAQDVLDLLDDFVDMRGKGLSDKLDVLIGQLVGQIGLVAHRQILELQRKKPLASIRKWLGSGG